MASASTLMQFECSICADDKRERALLIGSHPVCKECVLEIIPKFYEALKHEANYPVEWSAGKSLDPRDFAFFFDDFPAFLKQWQAREKEYLTPRSLRVYCACQAFLGERANTPDSIHCRSCEKLVCGQCGSGDKVHKCSSGVGDEDPLKHLPDCKRCPNKSCNTVLSLADGCNEVKCNMCRSNFCWVCLKLEPHYSHWRKGSCPRFGQPGYSRSLLYNEDVVQADNNVTEEETERQRNVREWVIFTRSQVLFRPLPESAPNAGDHAGSARQSGTRIGPHRSVYNRHRESLQSMHDGALVLRENMTARGEVIPPWISPFIRLNSLLMENINAWLHPEHVQANLDDYLRRHEEIMTIAFRARPMSPEFPSWQREYMLLFETYLAIFPTKLRDAALAIGVPVPWVRLRIPEAELR